MLYEFSRLVKNKKNLMVLSASGPRYGDKILTLEFRNMISRRMC
jgi:hypothetical protein